VEVVHEILEELGVQEKDMLYVFNKIDKADVELMHKEIEKYWPHVLISAKTKEGLQPLRDALGEWVFPVIK